MKFELDLSVFKSYKNYKLLAVKTVVFNTTANKSKWNLQIYRWVKFSD